MTTHAVAAAAGQTAAPGLFRTIVIRIILANLVMITAIFGSAGRLDWVMGWAFVAVYLVGMTTGVRVIWRVCPDLLAERTSLRTGVKKWDIALSSCMAVWLPLATLIVAGLDHRHEWTPPWPLAAQVAALALTGLGLFLVSRAMLANRFFSAVIRIQTDRGHHVVSSGPYRIVRHPGYVGGLMYWMPVPVALGSAWALIPSALFLVVTVIRTALEDRTLHHELPGYPEYAARVQYRLIPRVW